MTGNGIFHIPTRLIHSTIKEYEGKYKPELLFEDGEVIERIKEHPMAHWKINNGE